LYKIYGQLAKLPAHDYWERRVSKELQEEMKNAIGHIIKRCLSNGVKNYADYLNASAEKNKMNRYKRIYQDLDNEIPINLLPYVVLAKELGVLANHDEQA
jgi:glutamate dehydrogenase